MTLQRAQISGIAWLYIVSSSYFSVAGQELNTSTSADSRNTVVRELFDAALLSTNAHTVITKSASLTPGEEFDVLGAWVLPSVSHADFRMTSIPASWDLDPARGPGLRSPAISLVQNARASSRLAVLRASIWQIPESNELRNRCARQTLLLLVALEQGDAKASEQHMAAVNQFLGRDAIPEELRECAVIVGWAVQRNPQLANLILPVFVDEHQFVKRNAHRGGLTFWQKHVSQIAGWTKMRQTTQDAQHDSDKANLKNWLSVTPMTAREYAQGNYGTHWWATDQSVESFSGNANNLLIYRWPLLGDFEVTCQLSNFSIDPVQIMYAGRWISIHPDRERFHSGNLRSATDIEAAEKISDPRGPVRYTMTVKDYDVSIVFNGREVHRFELGETHDPWLAIRCTAPFNGKIKDLSIHGTPSVPATVPLITSEQMDEWVPWQASGLAGPHDNAAWTLTAGSANQKVLIGKKRIDLHGTNAESLINHYRPIVEAGTIRYEYFYAPGESLVHPALGRLAMLIRPGEILFRDITAAAYEGTLPAEDSHLDDGVSASLYSPDIIKQNDWNTVELSVRENAFRLAINSVEVCNGEIPRHNSRTFGLFHFADRTEARVRNIEWTGDWSDRIPDSSEQQLTDQTMAQLDKTAKLLPAVFEHDFVKDGLNKEHFSSKLNNGHSVQESELGVQAMCATSAKRFGSARIVPSFELIGDFDIVAEFSDFQVDGKGTGSARITIRHAEAERTIARFLRLDQQRGFKTICKDPSGSLPEIKMVSDATSGRLRIARRGQTYSFAFAEAGSSRFYLLATETGTAQPISADEWRLAITSQGETSASVVWKNLRLAAERLRHIPSKNTSGRKAVYVVTLPDTDKLIDPKVPLWRQYCERRIEEFKLDAVGDASDPAIRIPEPIGTSRKGQFANGLVYLWTQPNSRPVAIGTVQIEGTGETDLLEVNEFHSLHSSDIFMTENGTVQWSLQTPGLQWIELPDAPKPAGSKEDIFTQANQLAKRFSGAVRNPEASVPRRKNSLYEYSWSKGKVIHGGILTSFDNDVDPEILLCLEVRKSIDGKIRWHYAGANYSGGPAFLSLDQEVVWQESPAKFGKNYVHRGWFASRDLNLREAIVSTVQGDVEKVFDQPVDVNNITQPEWAFDQKSLVFHRSEPVGGLAEATMGRLDLSTGILTDIGKGCMPCLAPDGKRMVFNRVGSGVMRARADGTGEEVLDSGGWAVGWSPDGRSIVWGTRNNCTLLDLETGKRRVLLTAEQSAKIEYMYWNISWSPNSKSIAFNAVESGSGQEILVVTDIDDPQAFHIMFRGDIKPDISWHPDSEQVAFVRVEGDGKRRLYIMHRSTDESPRLLPGQPHGFKIQDVDWSPDGKKITFVAIPPAVPVEWPQDRQQDASPDLQNVD